MKLYAFSDFHLSGDPPTKPMDIFGPAWNNHREKIINAWMETIHPEDTVIMAGDLSWAMHIQDAISDLKMLGTLPGRKIIVRGNHDYWWDTVTKMTRMTDGAFEFIHNSALSVGPIAIAGTRGWIAETSRKLTEADKPIILREEGRLERSLELASKMNPERIIAVLHYQPLDEQRHPTHLLQAKPTATALRRRTQKSDPYAAAHDQVPCHRLRLWPHPRRHEFPEPPRGARRHPPPPHLG